MIKKPKKVKPGYKKKLNKQQKTLKKDKDRIKKKK